MTRPILEISWCYLKNQTRAKENCGRQPFCVASPSSMGHVASGSLWRLYDPLRLTDSLGTKSILCKMKESFESLKVVRGLCHHHQVMSAVPESQVWVDVMKYRIPEEFLMEMTYVTPREQNIAEYRYSVLEDHGIHSAWLITFFEKVTFIGLILSSDNSLIEKAGGQG